MILHKWDWALSALLKHSKLIPKCSAFVSWTDNLSSIPWNRNGGEHTGQSRKKYTFTYDKKAQQVLGCKKITCLVGQHKNVVQKGIKIHQNLQSISNFWNKVQSCMDH